MIARSITLKQQPRWQAELRQAITNPAELISLLRLDVAFLPEAHSADRMFRLRVPRSFVALMRPGDANDPLLRQVLPLGAEGKTSPDYSFDPVGDLSVMSAPGLLHKYAGRALLITSPACAVHCRYCFRRHFPYAEANAAEQQFSAALTAIESDPSIEEVILSGGDPLTLPDERLAELAARLDAIPHLRRLRVHTRLPVVLPSRVDEALIQWLSIGRLSKLVVLHINHPQEIGPELRMAAADLRRAGIPMLNQSVLLAGINDQASVLRNLSSALFDAGILPYYLHALDRVQGASHFEVPLEHALELMRELRSTLPGYLVPRFVREIPGEPSKHPIM